DMEKYSFGRVLGRGSEGKMMLGCNNQNNNKVAIKYLGQEHSILNAMVNEVEILEECAGHVNIINLLDVTTNKNGSFMVFDLMETDLKHHRRLEKQEIRSFMGQILSGLAWIHSNKIVHQDIKPENLLVKGGVVKLADFGHTRRLWEQPRECFGTLSYHSPKQLKGERGLYSTAIDIWAVGCVFAELVL
ncbi:hypothetical protein SELMODRAFT_4772, partial [Selaginella moellendorffii]